MGNHQMGRAAPCKSGPDSRVFPARNTFTDSANRSGNQHLPRPPATSAIMAALTSALAETDPSGRPELLEWTAERCLIGLVHERGPRIAACTAYRLADTLAGGVR